MVEQKDNKGSGILRALRILEAAAGATRPLNATEIHIALDVPKPTAHRICQTLIEEGYLTQEIDGKRLLPGPRLSRLALSALNASVLSAERRTILESVANEIGETSNIAVPDGARMRYLDRVETHWPLRVQFPVGSAVPLHCTSSGKLYLAMMSRNRRRRLIERLALDAHTENTITDLEVLNSQLDQIRSEQLGTDNEEFVDNMVALAVPVLGEAENFCATLSFHAPTQRVTFEQARQFEPILREGARKLSRTLEAADN